MSFLPLAFGFPAILWGLLALPVIWLPFTVMVWVMDTLPAPRSVAGRFAPATDTGGSLIFLSCAWSCAMNC